MNGASRPDPDPTPHGGTPAAALHARFERLFANSTAIVFAKLADGRHCYVNRAFEQGFAIPAERVLGRRLEEFQYPGLVERVGRIEADMLASPRAVVYEETMSGPGGERAYSVLKFPLLEDDGRLFSVWAVATDVTARKAVESALADREEQYRAIFDASSEGLALIDGSYRFVDCNPAFLRMHGVAREALLGVSIETVRDPDLRAQCMAMVATGLAGGSRRAEMRSPLPAGGTVEVEIEVAPIRYRKAPHVLVMMRDLTQRREAERERTRMEAQLRQAQKMEALGQLAGGIAHDFNNHLASIMGHLTLAADRAETFEDPKLERWLEEAQRSSERARDLIRQMLTFGRGRLGDPRILALPALVRDTASLLRASLPATVELHAGIDDAVVPVRADPVQIEQVVMNLAINARDAIGAHGAIRLALRGAEGEGQCASCGTRMAGNYVEICVADDGPGIAPEVAARMFEPFFTTKGVGKGTGMGLATVHALVHEHGGHLRVESAPGAGAAFRVLLPAAAAALAQEAPPPPAPPQRAGRLAPLNGHVLLVDDDVAVLEFMRELVERWGLVSTAVADPLQARDLVAREPYRFDVVVTDQTMPRLSGMDLARAIATMRPDLPVLVCSGYGSEIPASALADAGIRGVLEKPVDPVQLHRRLEACLDMSGTRTTAARRVRLGTSASILTYLLPPLIRSLRAEHPDIELAISTGSAMGLIDRVLRNGIDLGVVTLPVEDRDIEVLRLGEEELVALLPPAAGARTSIGPHEIAQFELVGENKRANLTRVIHAWLERAGAVPRTPMEIDSVEAIKQCVAAGLGAAVVPRSSVEGSNAPAGVCVCSLEPTLTRAIGLIRRRGAPERRELDDVGAVLSRLRDQL